MPNSQKTIIALDFDGVICDSLDELAISGYRAGRSTWPDRFPTDPPVGYRSDFTAVRHLLTTGYESLFLARSIMDGMDCRQITANYARIRAEFLHAEGGGTAPWIERLATARAEWMTTDMAGWLAAHRFYSGVPAALREFQRREYRLVILTTKEKRFTKPLLDYADIAIPEEDIFGLREGKKIEILQALVRNPDHRETPIHFVEDRLESLDEAAGIRALDQVTLYLATWGYNIEEQRRRAMSMARIRLITIEEIQGIGT